MFKEQENKNEFLEVKKMMKKSENSSDNFASNSKDKSLEESNSELS